MTNTTLIAILKTYPQDHKVVVGIPSNDKNDTLYIEYVFKVKKINLEYDRGDGILISAEVS